ncbi:MAG: nucleotidyltransferase domain-containing protein [Gemmatimonadaceae bacterium]
MGLESVIGRRHAEREQLLDRARTFVSAVGLKVALRAAVVFGSVARGDFNRWSDIDLLVVAEDLPLGAGARLDALGTWPAGIQPIAWTPREWRDQLARRNPIAIDAVAGGVWLAGSKDDLTE